MEPQEGSDTASVQYFISEDRRPLASVPTLVCTETSERYLLWTDIQGTFPSVSYLRDLRGSRILFLIDNYGEL